MKKLILLFTICASFAIAANAQTKPSEFKFEKETHDFGRVIIGTPVTYEFKFVNLGDEPLLITKAETTSGTVADFTKTAIKTGEAGIVKVTFNASGEAMPFSKTIKLLSNSKTPSKTLYIKGITANN